MGEYADYILNGDDCQECGEHIGEGDGYPRSCAGCAREEKRPTRRDNPDAPFIMQNTAGAKCALKHWLKARRYNAWSFGQTDKKGQPLIGLSWEHKPDSDWSKHDRAGLIICRDDAALNAALEILKSADKKKGNRHDR